MNGYLCRCGTYPRILQAESASFIWDAPRPVSRPESVPPQTSKSVMFCPAVVDHEARLFEITCPVELRLGFALPSRVSRC